MNQRWSKVFLTALRIAVGWHFLYEGVFKMDSDTGSVQYVTGRYVVQTATERLQRDGDIDAWHDSIVRGFGAQKQLADDQKIRLAEFRDALKLEPDAVHRFDWTWVHEQILKVPPEVESDRFTSLPFLQASAGPFRGMFRSLAYDMDGLERLTVASAQTRIGERYQQAVRHLKLDASQQKRLAEVRDRLQAQVAATIDAQWFQTRLSDYKAMHARVTASTTDAPFTFERRDADRKKLDATAAELLAFVNEPLSELAFQACLIATPQQLGAGPIPRPSSTTQRIDTVVTYALTAIGLCLMLGLFTPVAACAAAAQLLMFYLASPPLPGLPAATLGGHYLYVDRNLIEMIAALVIATTGSGLYAGLDAYVGKYTAAFRSRRQPVAVLEPALTR